MKLFVAFYLILIAMVSVAKADENLLFSIEWIEQIGGSSSDTFEEVTTDSSGNIFAVGRTAANFRGPSLGGIDSFLTKFDEAGDELWTKKIGTNRADYANSVAVDLFDNVYIAGYTNGDLTNPLNTVNSPDAYFIKMDSNGNELWVKQFGPEGDDFINSVAIDSSGNSYLAGHRRVTGVSDLDGFLIKLDANGNEIWNQQFATERQEIVSSVVVDKFGNSFISGRIGGSGGLRADVFVKKFSLDGNEIWSQQIGTNASDFGDSIAVDQHGNVYVGGATDSSFNSTSNFGSRDAFLAKFDSEGAELWIEQFGGDGLDFIRDIAVDNLGKVFVAGSVSSMIDDDDSDSFDAFLKIFNDAGEELWQYTTLTSEDTLGFSIHVDEGGSLYLAGTTNADFGAVNAGFRDAFLIKFSEPIPEPSSLLLAGTFMLFSCRLRK